MIGKDENAPNWTAQIYWFLNPYDLIINHLSLWSDSDDSYELPDWLAGIHPSGTNDRTPEDYAAYLKLFRLASEKGKSASKPKDYDNLRSPPPKYLHETDAVVASLETQFKEIKHAESLLSRFPQKKSDASLLASALWKVPKNTAGIPTENGKLIDPGTFTRVLLVEPTKAKAKNWGSWADAFYVYGDLMLFKKHKETPNGSAIEHLVQLKHLKRLLASESTKDWNPHFVIGSFFADGIPDFAVFFPLRDSPGHEGIRYIRQVAQSLAPLVFRERQEFLHRWVHRLRTAIDLNILVKKAPAKSTIKNKSVDTKDRKKELEDRKKEIELIAERLMFMAATLLFLNPKEIAQPLRIILSSQLESCVENGAFESDKLKTIAKELYELAVKDDEHRETLRLKYVEDFLLQSIRMIANLCRARSSGNLKGILSVDTTRKLSAAADRESKRLLLIGAPGGGKGAATGDFHLFRMQRIANREDLRHKWLLEIKRIVEEIYKLPVGENHKDQHAWFSKQIVGTKWWHWESGNTKEVAKCACAGSLEDGGLKGALPRSCGSCKFGNYFAKINVSHLKKNSRLTQQLEKYTYIRGYLARIEAQLKLISELSRPKNSIESKALFDAVEFNKIQIACGTLFSEGEPLLSSMERLFGKSEPTITPGLFQTSSYMGATLFLDEVADAPVTIQDNLLMPLEERKVARRGWETFLEDVSNVVIVSATHKDLRKEVDRFHKSSGSERPVGFRPDLLTRLAQFPPIEVKPVSAYFVYDEGDPNNGAGNPNRREDFRKEFASILADPKIPGNMGFWLRVYDYVDARLSETSHLHRFSGSDAIERRKKLSISLSMRVFIAIKHIGFTSNFDREAEGYIFGEYLPDVLAYLAESE